MVDSFTEQAEEIKAICGRLEIDPIELGEAAGIAPETRRKYAKGYQPASSIAMTSLRNVEKLRLVLREGNRSPKKTDSNQSHSLVETQTLDRILQDLAGRLAKATLTERKHVLGNLRDVLDELEDREHIHPSTPPSGPPKSKPSSAEETVAAKVLNRASALKHKPAADQSS